MSCNYADGLSEYEYKGKLGLPEIFDDPQELERKVELLAKWIISAKYVVVHTGAGISTSAGIPDFRGPNGVWTLEKKGEKPTINTSFDAAIPTLTHMTLKQLVDNGKVKFIISQNIDGLHLRSGVKRTSMAELHGNMFVAKCNFCEKFFVLTEAAPTVGEKEIGRNCPAVKSGGRGCRGKLIDTLLDWEANLPDLELEAAGIHSSLADLSICLGTTLQIVPAGNLPLRAKKNPDGKLVIINLQPTKHDKKADLIIHAKVDTVMTALAPLLGVASPDYSSAIDPTQFLKQNKCSLIEWTIPASSIKRLRAEMAIKKSTNSPQLKPATKRKWEPTPNPSKAEPSDNLKEEKVEAKKFASEIVVDLTQPLLPETFKIEYKPIITDQEQNPP